MTFHSYACYNHQLYDYTYNHQLYDYTHDCICYKDIVQGDFVRYYPDLSDDNTWIDGNVVETFMVGSDKELKLNCITHAVKATQCVLITFKNAA